jgi:hypothetical protein
VSEDEGGFIAAAAHELIPKCGKFTETLPKFRDLISWNPTEMILDVKITLRPFRSIEI